MNQPADLPLRDIHLPADPTWWPPAPGWWILLALTILAVVLTLWLRKRRLQQRLSAVNLARESLFTLRKEYQLQGDAKATVGELSILLRRLSISAFPRTDTAGLTGDAWLQFLDQTISNDRFSKGPGRILVDAPYRKEVKDDELDPLFDLCASWIDAVTKEKGRAIT